MTRRASPNPKVRRSSRQVDENGVRDAAHNRRSVLAGGGPTKHERARIACGVQRRKRSFLRRPPKRLKRGPSTRPQLVATITVSERTGATGIGGRAMIRAKSASGT